MCLHGSTSCFTGPCFRSIPTTSCSVFAIGVRVRARAHRAPDVITGTYGETILSPLAAVAVFLLLLYVLFAPRRKAIVPLLIAACTIPMAQRIVIAGADFTMVRILIVGYLARVMIRGEYRAIAWNRLDFVIVIWCVSRTTVMPLAHGTTDILVYAIGWSFDKLGIYFAGRFLIRNWGDLRYAAGAVAALSIPVAVVFAYEWTTGYNMFSVLGDVPERTWIRGGRLRCQGAFAHPILAGTFFASAMPLVWTLRGQKKLLMRFGTFSCLFIVAACSSSTPILSVLVAFFGAALFPLRRFRTHMWVGFFTFLGFLHVVMKAPVWHLMSRMDFTGGSTGYHRYEVFNAFVTHFSEWYLLGEPDPMSWGIWFMRDVTNMYVAQGLTGGLITLLLFLLVIGFAFGNVGRALKAPAAVRSLKRQWICWCIGVAILVHAVTFFGVTYFGGQMMVILYLELSLTTCVYSFTRRDTIKLIAKKRRLLEAQQARPQLAGA